MIVKEEKTCWVNFSFFLFPMFLKKILNILLKVEIYVIPAVFLDFQVLVNS